MNRAERICKLSVCIKIRGFVRPCASVHRSRGSYALSSAVSTFGTKKRRRDFQRGGTWVHLFGSVPEARTAEAVGRNKQTRREKTTPTTFNITCRRAARVYARTTERAQASDYANMGAASTLPLFYHLKIPFYSCII